MSLGFLGIRFYFLGIRFYRDTRMLSVEKEECYNSKFNYNLFSKERLVNPRGFDLYRYSIDSIEESGFEIEIIERKGGINRRKSPAFSISRVENSISRIDRKDRIHRLDRSRFSFHL
uniref:Uncharacterized protein n=1 Tax=Thalassia hemprichii TaxID=55496 RepID=A0A4Y1KCH1_9LILI|nr:hypothetical protein [Thalassia hemprichii]YP_009667438.1 hypothetical protein [Thalassia hemprichii]ATP74954.1 hypothetical protein [Thalassia hemprichii]ATP74995.1 hypothetical protein [Thalassia hemprichii]